ncbi:hypothetical protein DYBT9275_01381 [Dyadobacter sp. CECT 9275]|uniref:FecR family protein n=1 Tax=Dyadobacter helix TaxID=2822344 RepID=A0A916JB53_9BACT|nr:FecR domain-containing protein [Dyadobacter sp. CECT 9275]CAG4994389.1 hypothetical protein DYBT9275_01381 [Dyadobacter sp. CECT 9275]
MSDQTPWPLIAKYLTGECSLDEMSFMETWLEDEENHLLFQQLESAWRNQQIPENNSFSLERGLHVLHSRMAAQKQQAAENRILSISANAWFMAASIILILGIAFNFYKGMITARPALAFEQKVTGNYDVIKITLPDSSTVWLNKKSILTYPVVFEGDLREVTLVGEAFFEIKPNKEKPFIVKSKGISTRVLGTSFNVRSYPDEKDGEVSVMTGKVEVNTESINGSVPASSKITPMQKLVVDTQNAQTYTSIVRLNNIAAWRLDPLAFRDNTYEEVAKSLEDRYGKKIRILNSKLRGCRVMASFNRDARLADILKLLSISNSFHYKISGDEVIITGGVCH